MGHQQQELTKRFGFEWVNSPTQRPQGMFFLRQYLSCLALVGMSNEVWTTLRNEHPLRHLVLLQQYIPVVTIAAYAFRTRV
jgi:hypothetical protein